MKNESNFGTYTAYALILTMLTMGNQQIWINPAKSIQNSPNFGMYGFTLAIIYYKMRQQLKN
jgi:hypothetical protein